MSFPNSLKLFLQYFSYSISKKKLVIRKPLKSLLLLQQKTLNLFCAEKVFK